MPDNDDSGGVDPGPDDARVAIARQRRQAIWWAIVAGSAGLLIVSVFNPSLALLAGGLVVVLGTFGAAVGWVMRWMDRKLK